MYPHRAPAASEQDNPNSNSEHLDSNFTEVLCTFVDFYPKLWYDIREVEFCQDAAMSIERKEC
jgi:hypothetical protein